MIRKLIAKLLYAFYWRRIQQEKRSEERRIVPVYSHNTNVDTLEDLISWFQSNDYTFISSEDMINQVNNGIKSNKQVWLSFDDGYEKNFTDLFPILKKHNVPATFFIATKGVKDGYFWYQRAFQNRNSQFYEEVQELWEMPNKQRVEIIEKLPAYVGGRNAISPDSLKSLGSAVNIITIANHTHDHVICDFCTDEELIEQINICETKLKSQCVNYKTYFSYPNGNYNERVMGIIKQLGFNMACTTQYGFITEKTNLFDVPRNDIKDYASKEEAVLSSYNLWSPFFRKVKNLLKIVNKK